MARRTEHHAPGNGMAPEAERGIENSVATSGSPAQAPTAATTSRSAARKAPDPAVENSIEVSRARAAAQTVESRGASTSSAAASADPRAVPEEIKQRYVIVDDVFHFQNGDPAFKDKGNRLVTKLENTDVIRDMIAVARERGGEEITVGGSKSFRKAAWMQAKALGLDVLGYTPTELDKAILVRRLDRERRQGEDLHRSEPSPSPRSVREPARTAETEAPQQQSLGIAPLPTPSRVHRGLLVEHGPANFEFRSNTRPSYYVTLETPQGEHTVWGIELGSALKDSLSRAKIGEEVELRHLGSKPVTVTRPRQGPDGEVYQDETLVTHRNHWRVETREFFDERAKAAALLRDRSVDPKVATAQRPELAGTFVELQAAKLAAPSLYADRADQQRFVERFRETLAREIETGEPLSAARLPGRTQRQQREEARSQRLVQERVLS